jgi:hypothetical protein
MTNESKNVILLVLIIVLIIGVIIGAMFLFPAWNVWRAEQEGKAELARAEGNKQIILIEAQQRVEAAVHDAEAERIRAQGAADAMEIISGNLCEIYLRYRWILTISNNDNVIYIPTEAGLPILEAGGRYHPDFPATGTRADNN